MFKGYGAKVGLGNMRVKAENRMVTSFSLGIAFILANIFFSLAFVYFPFVFYLAPYYEYVASYLSNSASLRVKYGFANGD